MCHQSCLLALLFCTSFDTKLVVSENPFLLVGKIGVAWNIHKKRGTLVHLHGYIQILAIFNVFAQRLKLSFFEVFFFFFFASIYFTRMAR